MKSEVELLREQLAKLEQKLDQLEKEHNSLELKNAELDTLIKNIPGCVHRCQMFGHIHIDYSSDGLCKLCGYTKEELKEMCGDVFTEIVHPEDRDYFLENIFAMAAEIGQRVFEYRIIKKDGGIIWVMESMCSVELSNGERWAFAVVIDITEQKKMQEKASLNQKRYETILKQTNDIVFEVDIVNREISYSDSFFDRFKRLPITNNFPFSLIEQKIICPEDAYMISSLYEESDIIEKNFSIEFRALSGEGEYEWYKAITTILRNENDVAIKAIGILTNISEEKRRIDELLLKAKTDSVTKLLNRYAFEKYATYEIGENYGNNQNAFLIIDVDDFKYANDSFGHPFGDEILINVSERIKTLFRSEDLIGRIGGDEFTIFIKNITRKELLEQKLEKLVCKVSETIIIGGISYRQTISIGAILNVSKKKYAYDKYYKMADEALYEAKHNGKNQWKIKLI